MLHSVFHVVDIWCHRYLFYRVGFQNQLKPRNKFVLVSTGHLLGHLCKGETFCQKAGCPLGHHQLLRTWTKSLCSREGIQLAYGLPHHPSSGCLVSSWAIVLPPSRLKHSPDRISVLEVDMRKWGVNFCWGHSLQHKQIWTFYRVRTLTSRMLKVKNISLLLHRPLLFPSILLFLCGNLFTLLSQVFTKDFNRAKTSTLAGQC